MEFPLHSLTGEYLDRLRFDAEQAATLRAIGEYRGKQALYYVQAPISDIEAACAGVSRDTVRLVLRVMKKEGMIASTGKGRSAKWLRLPHAQ